jgi:hypothetical protein
VEAPGPGFATRIAGSRPGSQRKQKAPRVAWTPGAYRSLSAGCFYTALTFWAWDRRAIGVPLLPAKFLIFCLMNALETHGRRGLPWLLLDSAVGFRPSLRSWTKASRSGSPGLHRLERRRLVSWCTSTRQYFKKGTGPVILEVQSPF